VFVSIGVAIADANRQSAKKLFCTAIIEKKRLIINVFRTHYYLIIILI